MIFSMLLVAFVFLAGQFSTFVGLMGNRIGQFILKLVANLFETLLDHSLARIQLVDAQFVQKSFQIKLANNY